MIFLFLFLFLLCNCNDGLKLFSSFVPTNQTFYFVTAGRINVDLVNC